MLNEKNFEYTKYKIELNGTKCKIIEVTKTLSPTLIPYSTRWFTS